MTQKTLTGKGGWKHSARVAWRKVSDEAIILDVESAVYFSLTGAGLRMWELLGEGRSVLEIGKRLAAEFEASEDQIRDDCADLVGLLRKERLLERA